MKTYLLVLILCICSIQKCLAQDEDGVVALSLPNRNSLTFNRYTINPTFSFVREQTKFVSVSNKREWVQFENAPLTYLASYSGRFGENIGAGIALFQQNYGVLTTFGGTVNFAYNVQLQRDSNLTFGLNIGAYKSGINTASVISNYEDPSLQNVSDNFLLTVNPGINYGTGFFDFGIALNNLALYNISTSTLIKDNSKQGIQVHAMYTGYMMASRGFFDESKFTGLIKSEFQNDDTIISAIAMLTVPKGIWGQIGYNTRFGISGGLGINITSQIALEYNYEQAIGDLSSFGPSHDFTLAYRFKSNNRFDYSSGDKVSGLLMSDQKRRRKTNKTTTSKKNTADRVAQRKLAKDAETKRLAAQQAKQQADAESKRLAAQQAKEQAEAETKRLAAQQAKEQAEAETKRLATQQAKKQAEAETKRLAVQQAKEQADAETKRLAAQQAKEQAEVEAKRLEVQQAKEQAEAEAKRLEVQQAKEQAEAEAKRLEVQQAKEQAEAEAKRLEVQQAKEQAEAEAKRLEVKQAEEQAEAEAKRLEVKQAEEQAENEAKRLELQQAETTETSIANASDKIGKSMYKITEDTKQSKTTQSKLLKELDAIITIKDKDLKALKNENDLSEKGIAVAPRPFKSIREENNKLQLLKSELENVITDRNEKIDELKSLYDDKFESDTIAMDEVYLYYKKALKRLESEQLSATQAKLKLEVKLSEIQVATEIERKRRIKKADFDNEEDRYSQDRASLKKLKETTTVSTVAYEEKDFDFGEKLSNNIQILKNVNQLDNGYYLVLAVHSNTKKRDAFISKVIASGGSNIDFFYDVNTSKYYIYRDKFDSIIQANKALKEKEKENKPFNKNISLVKIEN